MRVYAEKTTGRLLGAEMAVPAAEHMAHTLALAIDRQLTLEQLLTMPIYHPVLEEGMRSALRDALSEWQLDDRFALSRCESMQTEALD
jgi:dihydrolipoamide dehydrogenase